MIKLFIFLVLSFSVSVCCANPLVDDFKNLEKMLLDGRNITLQCFAKLNVYREKGRESNACNKYNSFVNKDLPKFSQEIKSAFKKFRENEVKYSNPEREIIYYYIFSIVNHGKAFVNIHSEANILENILPK